MSSLDDYLSLTTTITNSKKVLEEEMKVDYYLYIKQPAEYGKKVDTISDLFHLATAVNLWQFFDLHTINLELVPYHSEGIVFPNPCNKEQINYIQNRLQINLDHIKTKLTRPKPKLVIFNGKIFHILLIDQKLIKKDDHEQVKITNKFSVYFFRIDNNQCVLFDKFFQAHYWGITDYERRGYQG